MRLLFGKQRTSFTIVMALVILAMVLTACGSSGSSTTSGGSSSGSSSSGSSASTAGGKGCKNVAVLLPETATSARWDSKDRPLLEQSIKQQLPGATVSVVNAEGNAATQQSQAEQALTKGACILVVAANDSQAASAIVQKAKQSNVPVVAYDRLIQSKDLAYYVSFDNVRVGELQGQYIVDHHKKGDSISLINGAQTDNNALLFNQGVMNKIKPLIDSGDLKKVYDTYTPNWDNATAQTEMEAALTKNGNNIQIAYVANDGMATTVIAALKNQKLNGKVLVTGQDATVAGIQNILTGDQSMTVYKAISKEADGAAKLVAAISNGQDTKSLINGQVKTSDGTQIQSVLEQPVAVDKANVASTVIADNFVSKSEVCKGLPAGAGGVC